jgi:hypothetical protein
MATQVASLEPTTTQVLGVAVEQTSEPELPVQSPLTKQATQAPFVASHLGVAVSMATQVASLEPTTTQVLGVAVEQTSEPELPAQSPSAAQAYVVYPTLPLVWESVSVVLTTVNVTAVPVTPLLAKSDPAVTTMAPIPMASVAVMVRMVPDPVIAQVAVLVTVASVTVQVALPTSPVQIALDAVIVMKSEAPPAPEAPMARAAPLVKLSAKLPGAVPATKVLGTADVQATDVAVVATMVDTSVKARNIILLIFTFCGK